MKIHKERKNLRQIANMLDFDNPEHLEIFYKNDIRYNELTDMLLKHKDDILKELSCRKWKRSGLKPFTLG